MATTSPESVTASMGARKASVLARFKAAPAVTSEQYDESVRRLEALGDWPPAGLAYHVAFRSEGNRLMPVLKDVGVELSGEPEMLEIHNIIQR